jgi:ATP-dependent Clp protease ATP-binding subunit ClpA
LLVPKESRLFLLKRGTSSEYGAREIKRTLHRHLTQPLSSMIAEGRIDPGSSIHAQVSEDEEELILRAA